MPDLQTIARAFPNHRTGHLEACHILDDSILTSIDERDQNDTRVRVHRSTRFRVVETQYGVLVQPRCWIYFTLSASPQ